MSLEFISQLLNSMPFLPMELFLSDGRTDVVQNPELLMIAGDRRSISLFEPPTATEFIDLDHIVSVRVVDSRS